MPIIINDNPNDFSSWKDSTKHIYTILHKLSAASGGDVLEVNDNLVLEGTTNASTSQAIYGVNVITTATFSDKATRLPIPTTGRQTVFINNSLIPISVFPSVVGGEINGVVNGVASVPNDGRAYTFYCTENPLPGAWNWTAPAIGQLTYQEITSNHVNGVADSFFNAGIGTPDDASVGLGWGGGIITSGTWNTNNFPAWLEKIKLYTNIKYSDFPTTSTQILGSWTQGYQRSLTGTTTGNKATFAFQGSQTFPGANVQEVLSGTIGDNVGDLGTLYMEFTLNLLPILYRVMGNQCLTTPIPGNAGEICYSTGYYTFNINVPSTMPTKLYKFQWFLEYS